MDVRKGLKHPVRPSDSTLEFPILTPTKRIVKTQAGVRVNPLYTSLRAADWEDGRVLA